jgi:hypothetical protein
MLPDTRGSTTRTSGEHSFDSQRKIKLVRCPPMGGILASLLPGLRDLRAPLAAGYIWLATFWVAWGRKQTDLEHRQGLIGDAYQLAHTAGPLAIGAALSFAAYVLGILSISLFGSLRDRLRSMWADLRLIWRNTRRMRRKLKPDLPKQYPPLRVRMMIREQAKRYGIPQKGNEDFLDRQANRLVQDLDIVPFRLIGKEPELYGEYDRLRSEGEFRLAIAEPGILLFAFLAVSESWLWLIGLLGVIALEVLGLRKTDEADNLLYDALRVERVESPVLTDLENAYGRYLEEQEVLQERRFQELVRNAPDWQEEDEAPPHDFGEDSSPP